MAWPGSSVDTQNKSQNNQSTTANSYDVENISSTSSDNYASYPAPAYDVGIGDINNNQPSIGDINQGSTDKLPSSTPDDKTKKTGEKGEWKTPFDLETLSTASDIKKYIWRLTVNAISVGTIIKDSKDISGDLSKMEIDTEALTGMYTIINKKYAGEEEVELSDIEKLQSVSNKWEASFGDNFGNVKDASTGSLSKIQKFKKIDTHSPKLKEAMQDAFYESDNSLVKKLTDIVDVANEYNEKGGTLVGLATDNIGYVKDSALLDMLKDKSGRMSKMAGSVKETLDVAQNLEVLYDNTVDTGTHLGEAADSLGAIMNLADKVINFVDLPGLNVIQGLWNNVYKPMIDVCVSGIGKIENTLAKGRRDLIGIRIQKWKQKNIGKDNTAPTFVRGALDDNFEGGWQVFNFMWNVMCSEWDRIPNDTVVSYFEDNYDRLNAGAGQKEDIPYHYKGLSWYIDSEELMWWALGNKFKLWAMFYGSNLPIPPGTKGK